MMRRGGEGSEGGLLAANSLQKQPRRWALGMPTTHPRTCIFPAKAGQQVSFSHLMR
jgi:hypothetical protein